ncbi:V-type ATP synthase subunit D [Streptomyces sp. NPDC001634]|uniref:V-type ATP synthase subunit D n=1 Tax=Streptomyces sp. NPDC001634 TaxID=3154390 RepID=UPI00332D1E35
MRPACRGRCARPAEPTPGTTALAHAETAYRAAVRTAAEHATSRTAAELIAAEAERTRQRVRALRRHWILRLTREPAAVELALEEGEHEEAVRRRWAASSRNRARNRVRSRPVRHSAHLSEAAPSPRPPCRPGRSRAG